MVKKKSVVAAKKSVAAVKQVAEAKSNKKRVNFEIEAGIGKTVSVAGSFNDWDATAKVLVDKNGDGVYTGTMMLAPGVYEYKYVVDGDWRLDERNSNFAPNDLGTLNSVLVVE